MDSEIKTLGESCTTYSYEKRHSFLQLVGQLMAAGVERDHADSFRLEKI